MSPRKPKPPNRTQTTSMIAEIVGVSAATIRRWCSLGAPHDRISQRVMLLDAAELRAWRATTPHVNNGNRHAAKGGES